MQSAFFENEDLARRQRALVAACNGPIMAAQRGHAPVVLALEAIAGTNQHDAEAMPEILSVNYRQPVLDRVEAESLFG